MRFQSIQQVGDDLIAIGNEVHVEDEGNFMVTGIFAVPDGKGGVEVRVEVKCPMYKHGVEVGEYEIEVGVESVEVR